MTQTLTATDAKTRFGELTQRIVATGEHVVVTLDDDHMITMIPGSHPDHGTSIDDELAAIHELIKRDLNGRRLEPNPVELLRRIRDQE